MMRHYFEYLHDAMKSHWDREALCNYGGQSFTYHDIAERILKMHGFFAAAALAKGDRVAIYGRNSAQWGMAFLSSNTYQAITVPILADFRPEDASSLIGHSGARVLFTDSQVWDKLDLNAFTSLEYAISLSDFTLLWSRSGEGEKLMEESDAAFASSFPEGISVGDLHFEAPDTDSIIVINYTSGTTSSPKGVMISDGNFVTNVQYALDNIPPAEGDKIVSILPMAHMYGFMFEFLYPLCGGVTVYFFGKTPTPTLLMRAMKDVRPYLLITVPLVMEKIFKTSILPVVSKPAMKLMLALPGVSQLVCRKIRKKLMAAFGGNVRQFIMGGAALNPDAEKWFRRIKLPYMVGYGMTEAAPLMAYADWKSYAPGSCGRVVDRCEVRIDSDDPINTVGEIQARGMNIMKGYWQNEAATEAAFTRDGWFRTGDLGVVDAAGNIFIRGRSKNMILSSNGQNIYPEEIEAVINSMPCVQESLVVDRGNKLVALIHFDRQALSEKLPQIDRQTVTSAVGDALSDVAKFASSIVAQVNSKLPSYSKISKAETMDEPFAKTPKLSIKRFLYK